METQLGTLSVYLKMDAQNFKQNAAVVTRDMKQMSTQLANEWGISAKFIAGSAVAMATGIALAIRSVINEADKMGGTSEQLGIAVVQLSALKYAAEQSDVSFETLTQSLTKLNMALGAVAGGNAEANPATLAFRALGVSAYDTSGKLRSSGEVLAEVADKFAGYKDGANKASLAIALFGEQGVKLTPMLNKGAAGIAELKDEAQRLGVVIDGDTARAAKDFNDVLARMSASGQGVAFALGKKLLPDMKLLAEAMEIATREGGSMDTVLDGVALSFKGIATGAILTAANITVMGGSLKTMIQFARDFVNVGWDEAIKGSAKNAAELATTLGAMKTAVEGMWGQSENPMAGMGDELAKTNEELKAAAPAMQAVVDLTAKHAANLATYRQNQTQLLNDLLNSPTEEFAAKIQAIIDAYNAGTIGAYSFGQMNRQVMTDQAALMDNVVQASTAAATALFTDNKAVAIAAGLINTYLAITKALSSAPPPFNYALAAATAAQGFAAVNSIRAQKREFGGPVNANQPYWVGEKGPEMIVPRGAGTVIPNHSLGMRGGASSGGTVTHIIKGLSAKEFFTGQQMRDFAEQMLAFQRNGGQVILS